MGIFSTVKSVAEGLIDLTSRLRLNYKTSLKVNSVPSKKECRILDFEKRLAEQKEKLRKDFDCTLEAALKSQQTALEQKWNIESDKKIKDIIKEHQELFAEKVTTF